MRNQSIQGIVLRKRNLGENDQSVTIYSPALGKFDAIAKGSRKITSHFSGHLEILNICNFEIYTNGNRHLITQCQTINSFKCLKEDLDLAMHSFRIAEIFYRMTPSDEQGEDLFLLLLGTLSVLGSSKDPLILESFKIKLLKAAGSLPEMSECGGCRKKWRHGDIILMDSDGHISCSECVSGDLKKEQIGFNIIKLINFISSSEYNKITKISMTRKETAELQKICRLLIGSYSNFEIRSEKIAEQMLT